MADRVILAGLPFAASTAEELASWIASRRRGPGCAPVVSASVDFVVHASRDPELAEALRRSTLLAASAETIVWLSRLVGRALPPAVAGHELILSVAEQAVRTSAKLCILAVSLDKAEKAAHALSGRFARLSTVTAGSLGSIPPSPDAACDAELLERFGQCDADIFVIAAEAATDAARWIARCADRLPAGACILLTEPADLDRLAATLPATAADQVARSVDDSHRPGNLRRTLRELLAIAPVAIHEWTHLVGMREARLPHGEPGAAAATAVPVPLRRLKQLLLVAADMLMLCASFLVADVLRCRFWMHRPWPQPVLNSTQAWYWYLWLLPVLMALWPPILASLGLYRTALPPPTWRWRRAAAAGGVLFFLFSTLALFFSRIAYPRMLILLASCAAPLGFVLGRFALVAAARTRRWFNDLGLPDYSSY